MRREILLVALFCVSVKAQVKTERDVAPSSDLFPASWYPPDSEVVSFPAPTVGRPYEAVTVTKNIHKMPNGEERTFEQRAAQMRDSAGRLRSETAMKRPAPDGKIVDAREVTVDDPVAHCTLQWIEPWTDPGQPKGTVSCYGRIVHRTLSSPMIKEGYVPPDEPLPGGGVTHFEPLGTKVISGIRTLGMRTTRTGARAGNGELWYSPELQEIFALKIGGPDGYSLELTDIVQKEPDAALFYPPKEYKVLGPGSQ